MYRFYLPPSHYSGTTLALSGGEAHHAARVLRIQSGERVTVLDGAGTELLCEVLRVDKREVALQVIEKKTHPAPPCELVLLQAIPKGKIIESIIEKATELGTHRIVPLLTERVTIKLDENSAAEKGAKWQHVAVEAIKQCGAAWLPQVDAPVTLREFFATKPLFDLVLVGALQGAACHPRQVLQEFVTREGRRPRSIAIWIGPEGDLTRDELNQIQATGARPITLGPLVLRVETAAIYCLSFLNYEMQAG